MRMLRVSPIRLLPRPRNVVSGLVGALRVAISTCSKARDTFDSYLHVGSGQSPLKTDEKTLREILARHGLTSLAMERVEFEIDRLSFNIVSNRPAIPGSSVKGNIRSRLELSFVARSGRVRSCFTRATRFRGEPRIGSQGWRHFRIWRRSLIEDRGAPCDLTRAGSVCLVCDIFGTAGLGALVDFSDFVAEDVELVTLELERGIKLLAAPPSSTFQGRMSFRNLQPEELGLLLIGMGLREFRVGRPVLLGRLKYRKDIQGYKFGRVRYSVESMELSPISSSLKLPIRTVRAGELVAGDELDAVCKAMVAFAEERFGREMEIVDEVSRVEEL